MKFLTNISVLGLLLLTSFVLSSYEWVQGPQIENDKIIRTALWERDSREIAGKNAYADETSCVYNAANCAIDQVRKSVY